MLGWAQDATDHAWGGRLAFALVNSVLWRRSDEPEDTLTSYDRLVRLAELSGWLGGRDGEALRVAAPGHSEWADQELRDAVRLRETLWRVLSAVAGGREVDPEALARLDRAAREAHRGLHLVAGAVVPARPRWVLEMDLHAPRRLAALSALAVLTEDEPARVKQCPGERCGWLFLDVSRNRSRRWCEPRECGNRERARRHYARRRTDTA